MLVFYSNSLFAIYNLSIIFLLTFFDFHAIMRKMFSTETHTFTLGDRSMKKKTIFLSILTVLLAVVLSSCVRETYNFNISPDNSSVKREQVVTKELYDSLISMGSDASEIKDNGGELTFYTENNTEYVKITYSKTFTSLDELNTYLSSLGKNEEDSATDISDAFFTEIKVEADNENKIICINGTINEQDDISSYSACDIIFNFNNGKITDFDIGEKIDDNTISIDMVELWNLSSTTSFTIKAEIVSSTNWVVPVIIIIVFLIAGISFFVFFKKKQAAKYVVSETYDTENI